MLTRIESAVSGVHEAAELIRCGELVAFPTETVYGLGADAGNNAAIQRIYQVKGRPANNPLIVHVPDYAAAMEYSRRFPTMAVIFAKTFWPGPLTLVLQRNDRISPAVSAGNKTVAIRCPNHPVALALLRESKRPIAAPSANRSGYTSPTTAQHVADELDGHIPLILDGGPCDVGLESTVVDMTSAVPMILRPGAITQAMLASSLRQAGLAPDVAVPAGRAGISETDELKSPGLLERHYAPRTAAYRFYASDSAALRTYLEPRRDQRIGLLCFDGFAAPAEIKEKIVLPANAQQCAKAMYAALRELDRRRCDVLIVQCPETTDGVWSAIEDRLRRATKELPT